ncbi:MAG: hypothetical protein R3C14_53310 [Caldilineaceae bacterium]
MSEKLLGSLDSQEFADLIESFIEQVEPNTLSFTAFDQAVQRLAEEAVAETIELTGVIEDGAIVFDTPNAAPIVAQGNEVLIGGLRLVVRLRSAEAA